MIKRTEAARGAIDPIMVKFQDKIECEVITPKRAEDFLNRNTNNRKLRDGVVEKYAQDMKDGKWTECTVPIVFYDNGDVADGQHRLWAVIESGHNQKFFVLRGLPRSAGLNIDNGLGRTLVDNARISGSDGDLSNELVCVARCVDLGSRFTGRNPSNALALQYVKMHEEASRWAIKHGPMGKFMRNSMSLTAIARAWYLEEDKDRLARFCKVLGDGFSEGDQESAAVAIRNYLVQNGRTTILAPFWRDTFLKMQNAIYHFMRGRQLMVIKRVSEEAYPLKKNQRVTSAAELKSMKTKSPKSAGEAVS